MLELERVRAKLKVAFILIILFFISINFNVECQDNEEIPVINVDMTIDIYDVNIYEYYSLLDIHIWIRDFPYESDNITIIFTGLENYQIALEKIGGVGTYQYQGELLQKNWWTETFGEPFPYDYSKIMIRLYPYHLEYYENGTRYGLGHFKFQYDLEESHIHFIGINSEKLKNRWSIGKTKDENILNIFFLRRSTVGYVLYLMPLLFIHLLIFLAPVLNAFNLKNRNVMVRLYSSLLIFSTAYIFTLQDHLPPRETLCLPEFYSILILIFSTLMIINYLVDIKNGNHKSTYYLIDMIIYSICGVSYIIFKEIIYSGHIDAFKFVTYKLGFIKITPHIFFFIIPFFATICIIARYYSYNKTP